MRTLASFAADKHGNISIMFVFMLALVMLFTGGAVDFTRRNAVRTDLIESLDAAGLAIAQLDESGDYEDDYLKTYGKKVFHENFTHEEEIENLEIDFGINEQSITPSAQGEIKTLFLGVAEKLLGGGSNFERLSMATDTEITRKGSGPIELALVLDVTGSMSDTIDGVSKMSSLRTSVGALLDTLYGDEDDATNDNVLTSVVPFNAYVGAGAAVDEDGNAAWKSAWNDAGAEATYHGAHFLHVTSTGAIDLNTKVNHFNLFNSMSSTDWAGCFYERPFPLDEIDTPAGSATLTSIVNGYKTAPDGTTNSKVLSAFTGAPSLTLTSDVIASAANSRFVPLFTPDDPDCNNTNECNYGTTSRTNGSITFNGNWFDDPDSDSGIDERDYVNSFVSDNQYIYHTNTANIGKYLPVVNYVHRVFRTHAGASSSTCPSSPNSGVTNNALYTWLTGRNATSCSTDEYVVRQAYVGTFDSSTQKYVGKLNLTTSIDETIDEGTGDESTRGPNRGCTSSLLFSTNEKKAISDFVDELQPAGSTNSAEGMMWGWRVLSPDAPFESDIEYDDGKWQKAVVLMTDGFNTVNDRSTHWKSDLSTYGYAREERMGSGINTASKMRDELDNKLLRICARMKARGIIVYAITFGLDDSDADEAATKEVFQACATKAEEPYYFDAPDGEDLKEAFADIASDLVQLHVSR